MSPLDSAKPLERDDAEQATNDNAPANAAATRAAQAFAKSPQMKVLADIQQARAAKRSVR